MKLKTITASFEFDVEKFDLSNVTSNLFASRNSFQILCMKVFCIQNIKGSKQSYSQQLYLPIFTI